LGELRKPQFRIYGNFPSDMMASVHENDYVFSFIYIYGFLAKIVIVK